MSLEAIRELNKYLKEGKDHFLDLAPNFEAFTDLLSTEIIKKIKDLQSTKKDLLLLNNNNNLEKNSDEINNPSITPFLSPLVPRSFADESNSLTATTAKIEVIAINGSRNCQLADGWKNPRWR